MTHDGSAEIRWFCCQLLLLFVWMRAQFESGSEIFTVHIIHIVQCTVLRSRSVLYKVRQRRCRLKK